MAIQLNPLLAHGLATLAGNSMPQLGLKPVVYDVGAQNQGIAGGILKGLDLQQQQAALANAIALRQMQDNSEMDRTKLQEQGANYRSDNMLDKQMAIEGMRQQLGYDQLAQKAGNDADQRNIDMYKLKQGDRQFDLDQFYKTNDIDIKQQELVQKGMLEQLHLHMQMKKDDLEQLNGIMANTANAMNNAQDPETQAKIQQTALGIVHKNGLMGDDEYKAVSQMDPNTFRVYANAQSGVTHAAAVLKNDGFTATTDADGNPVLTLSKTMKETAAKTVQSFTPIQSQLDTWIQNWKPVYDTYKGQSEGILSNIAGKFGYTSEYQKQMSTAKENLNGLILNIATTLPNGRSKVVQEALKEFKPEESDSPDAVEGKQQGLQVWLNNHLNEAKQQLQTGTISLTPRSDKPVGYAGEIPSSASGSKTSEAKNTILTYNPKTGKLE